MNQEMKARLCKAGEYQRLAIRALFPEAMSGHLDAIEKEIKEMCMEMAMEMFMASKEQKEKESAGDEGTDTQPKGKTRKVEIL